MLKSGKVLSLLLPVCPFSPVVPLPPPVPSSKANALKRGFTCLAYIVDLPRFYLIRSVSVFSSLKLSKDCSPSEVTLS